MHQKRWLQIEEICLHALNLEAEERSAYITQACSGDVELFQAVEAFLDKGDYDDDFLRNPLFSAGLALIGSRRKSLSAGEDIGAYKVIKQIGCGGMGEVYLAEDRKLSRNVALKVLPTDITNKSLVNRFKNEARAASAISHPNVAHIYEIGENGKMLFIAMEYVEGATLRELLSGKSLPANQAVDIALQTASALAAAHEKGIIHRDVKPENIIIRPDNLVKVVDFGIAKLTTPASTIDNENNLPTNHNQFAPHVDHTEPGMLMGTTNYMSPEQVRGNETDARTDVWSLGVVLYEMIIGEKPFQSETKSDVIASILRNELPDFPQDTPVELNEIIKKSLNKNAAERYQSIGDVWLDLKKFEHITTANDSSADNLSARTTNTYRKPQTTDENYRQISGSAQSPRLTSKINNTGIFQTNRIFYTFAALSVGLILIIATAVKFGSIKSIWRSAPSETFQTMQMKKLTATGTKSHEMAAVSRDGKYTVYVAQEGSLRSLWLKPMGTSESSLLIAPAEVEYYSLNFSRDGNFIYYSIFANKKSKEFYQIPISGGSARKLSDDVGEGNVALSPDEKRIAFVRESRFLITADINGSNPQTTAAVPEDSVWSFPAWSPDGEIIVLATASQSDKQFRLVEVTVSNGSIKPVECPPWYRVSGITWLPDQSGLIISGRDSETKLSQLWMFDYTTDKLRRITNDLTNYKAASVTADGRTVVSVQQERISNIYVVPDENSELARKITFEKGTDDGMSGVALTSDDRIIYTSIQNGTRDLWIVNRDGSNNRPLTNNLKFSAFPTVSPDNRFVAFIVEQSGEVNIWRVDLADETLKQITFGAGAEASPNFTPDSKSIVYRYSENGKTSVWKVDVNGENPRQIIESELASPAVSPDGNFIAGVYKETPNSAYRVAVFPADGGRPLKLLDLPSITNIYNFIWSNDGKSLIYADRKNGFYNLWNQPLNGDAPKQLTNFKSGQIFRFAQSPDGKEFILAQATETSDVIMISDFK